MRQVSLSIFSSRQVTTALYLAAKAAVFVGVFLFLEQVTAGLLVPPQRFGPRFYPRLRWQEFYQSKANIDLLFLGSSHAYRSFDPEVFEEELGITAFNLGSSSQNPVDSYFVLREALRYHQPRLVVLEVYWRMLEREEEDFRSASLNFDFMRPSTNKLMYLLSAFTVEDYPRALFLTARFHKNITRLDYLRENIRRIAAFVTGHQGEDQAASSQWGAERYKGKGYVSNMNTVSMQELRSRRNEFSGYAGPDFKEKKVRYLRKILALCRRRGISLLLVTAPIPPTSLAMVSGYDAIHDFLAGLAAQFNVPYVDYNLINEREKLLHDFYFKDDDHLNARGVVIFNRHLIEYISGFERQGGTASIPEELVW